MRIERHADLSTHSTFRLPAAADELAVLDDADALPGLLDTDKPLMILGEGSNTVFADDYPGRIVLNRLRGIDSEVLDRDRVLVTAAAGENWHQLVRWSLDRGLWGIENLAMIPGLVGAAPMQNIGAYGVELAHCLDGVEVYDRREGIRRWLTPDEGGLDYRHSRFKGKDAGRFVILAIRMELNMDGTPVIEYPSLIAELKRHGHSQPDDPRTLAAAVMRVRKRKLPDPGQIPSCGSFFKNPVVDNGTARALVDAHPELPNWPDKPGRTKLSAAWMIDELGWRGHVRGGIEVFERHALVLVNRGGGTGAELLGLAGDIRDSVRVRFGVELEPEPVIVGGEV